jgi:hypothetical protein
MQWRVMPRLVLVARLLDSFDGPCACATGDDLCQLLNRAAGFRFRLKDFGSVARAKRLNAAGFDWTQPAGATRVERQHHDKFHQLKTPPDVSMVPLQLAPKGCYITGRLVRWVCNLRSNCSEPRQSP